MNDSMNKMRKMLENVLVETDRDVDKATEILVERYGFNEDIAWGLVRGFAGDTQEK